MFTLFHHPFCPHSRLVRLALAEYGIDARLIEERVWERRREFLALNPAGATPVLIEEGAPAIPGASVICEYLDEKFGPDLTDRRLLPFAVHDRVEVRRLMSWFNEKLFGEASGPLVEERVYKRFMGLQMGALGENSAPLAETIRAAKANVRYHLAYIGWLAQTRDWLAGDRLTFADLAAAAHLSAIDYLGDVPWAENEAAKAWYVRVKSRPSFRALLNEMLPGMPPAPHYTDLDF